MQQHIKTDPKTWSSPDPTAPVIESRVPIFAPILRVSHNSFSRIRCYETPWGWVEIAGPTLTQEHRAILDMALSRAVKKQVFQKTGGMAVWFDAYEVKKALGYKGGSGHKRFVERIRELRRADFRVHSNKTGKTRESGIIDSHTYDESHPDNPERQGIRRRDGKAHCLYEIRLSPNFMQFFKEELRVHYDSLVPEIVRIPDGTIRGIIQFFLTHEEKCQYSIHKTMVIIGAITKGMAKSTVSEIMAKPGKFKTELETFGIFVEGETLRYKRHPKVFFTNPPEASTGTVINAEPAPGQVSATLALEAAPDGIVRPQAPENDHSYRALKAIEPF